MQLPLVFRRKRRPRRRPPKVFIPTSSRWPGAFFFKFLGIFFISPLFLLGLALILRSKIFIVRDIRCHSATVIFYDSSQWCHALERKTLGKLIWSLDSTRVAQELKRVSLEIDKIQIKKRLPRALEAEIFGRQPLAVAEIYKYEEIQPEATPPAVLKGRFLVDSDGLVFAPALTGGGLPKILLESTKPVEVGDKLLGKGANFFLETLRLIKDAKIEATRIQEGSNGQTLLSIKGGPTVLVSRHKSVAEQISALRLILEKYKIEGKKLKRVDLRFEKPVVHY